MTKKLLIYYGKELCTNYFKLSLLILTFLYNFIFCCLFIFKVVDFDFLEIITIPAIIYLVLVLINWMTLIWAISKMKAGQYLPSTKLKSEIAEVKLLFCQKASKTQIANKILQFHFYQLIIQALVSIIITFLAIIILIFL